MNEGRYSVGQVWMMSFDSDPEVFVFLLLELNNVGTSFWNILVLESGPIFATSPGTRTFITLSDVSFFGDVGYDSYDNMYTRLA